MRAKKSVPTPRRDVERVLRSSNGKFFSVTFVKKDGTPRHLTGRTAVRKGVKGVGMSFDPKLHNLMTVFDVEKEDFRMINLDTVLEATVNSTRYVFY